VSSEPSPKADRLREALALLRREVPTMAPVRLYIRGAARMGDARGLCEARYSKGRLMGYSIFLLNTMGYNEALDVLTHEYAHALSYHDVDHVDDHDGSWGMWLARCYRVLEDL
jgi:hypothetical protein